MAKKEIRYLMQPLEVREAKDKAATVEGYAAVFNSDSVDMGFTERIDPKAFDGVIERSDVVALYNHNETPGVLARSTNGEGTLHLEVDDHGLRCSFQMPDTTLGRDLTESCKRGDIKGMSIAFTVKSDTWEHRKDDTYLRTINQIDRLFDVSLVVTPAYPATSVETKGLDELKAKETLEKHRQEEAEQRKADDAKRQDLLEYYRNQRMRIY